MAKISSRKSAGFVAVILFSLLLTVIAQPGFLSIACGAKANHTVEENNITWVSDANYIQVGETADIEDASQLAYGSYMRTLRFFPKPLKKSCYQLPVNPSVPYFLRLWFSIGNYTGFHMPLPSFRYSIETLGHLFVKDVKLKDINPHSTEKIFVSSGSVLYICLIRTMESDQDPFINAIELRKLRDGMYPQAKPGIMLSIETRYDVGGNSPVRYPQDEFDRIWESDRGLSVATYPANTIQKVRSEELISTNNTQDLPPSVVMQTAWTTSGQMLLFSFNLIETNPLLLLLYLAEIEPLNMTETRSFSVLINRMPRSGTITTVRNYSALVLPFLLHETLSELILLKAANYSTLGPIINAFEAYSIIHMVSATYIEDIKALDAIKTRFDIKSWISDPCYVINWDGIGCDNSSSVIRISEMNLSGMNLTGSVPQNIRQLTALVNLSLENNHLTGPLPNFSDLTMLERLHLRNNNLTGSVPEWLCGLKNLKELFIENNDFSGVIPAQLLSNPSLKFRHIGNRYLYTLSNPNKARLRLILGITISGGIPIVLLLIVGVAVHRKKSRRKESNKVEKESKHSMGEDNSKIILPNTTKSRAFTLEEIKAATQNFSHKIGQGGFGSVFFGKLQQEKDIAVKVLSLSADQGVQEFLNEVDLLSRVHHKNLVSLLGYCNESSELMLVYEYMAGGSLRDHLYGPRADLSQLNWKTRLKIASDAAQGLEYLHVDCTPKIIHRDIKTANILLDSYFNGKLADFGLSRVRVEGDASHVTTTVKGTFGYLDPEYFSTQMLTVKSDVYSFGVVLLEIICGRQPINANLSEEQLNLIRWVTPYVEMNESPGKLEEIIDKRLGTNYDIKSITEVAKLALRCVQAEPSSRPHVTEVVEELKEAIKLENDKDSQISEVYIKNGDYSASPACVSVDSSRSKETESADSSRSKLPTVFQEGR